MINIKPSKSQQSYCPKGKSCFKFVTWFSKLRHTNGMVFYVLCLSRHKQENFTASLACLNSSIFKYESYQNVSTFKKLLISNFINDGFTKP